MNSPKIDQYINQAYGRWLEYAQFQAIQYGIPQEAGDVLNTVMESLLGKDQSKIEEMLSRKKGKFTELDFFVLRMIKLNTYSPTSPYRNKTKGLPKDANVDPWCLDLVDDDPEEESYGERLLRHWRSARDILEELDIPEREKEIFAWKFFGGQSLISCPGKESYTAKCEAYNTVAEAMKKANNPSIFPNPPTVERLALRLTKYSILDQKERTRRLAVRLLHIRVDNKGVA